MSEPQQHPMHLRIAEQGKLFALSGDYARALGCYRIAMRLAVEGGEPEAFFRHYLECLVEALELDGAYDSVLEYCRQMEGMWEKVTAENDLMRYDKAVLQQRRGIVLLKMDRLAEAEEALGNACERARDLDTELPLADTVLRWLRSRLKIDGRRLQEEQNRHRYFSVRAEAVQPELAVALTDAEIFGPMAATSNSNP